MTDNDKYIENLMKELAEQGVTPPNTQVSQIVSNVDDRELQIVHDMEKITGRKFSDEQRKILFHHGNACILACAGSGKTTVSVNLIAKRLMTGEIKDASKLIYTTYSKAGATEMKERMDILLKQLGMGHINVQVRTIHSFFLQVLRIFGVTADIISNNDRAKFIKQACKDINFTLKDDDLMLLDNLLSYQVNNLLSDRKTIEAYVNTLEDLTLEQYTAIRKSYADQKNQKGLIDYDDMQSFLYLWLVKYAKSKNPQEVEIAASVRNYCKAMWTDFYIDEAQDVSKIQFAIIRAMVAEPNDTSKLDKNLVFIGDDDQCLVEGTKVFTIDGVKNIEDIQYLDKVASCTGHGDWDYIEVDNGSSKEIDDDIVVIKTKSGLTLKGTYNHIGFAKLVPRENEYYTYLMYRHDFGFRIGTTSGVRAGVRKGIVNGIEMRLIQEKSDKVWILKVCDTEQDAKYWEAYFAYKYSIPMYRFVTSDTYSGVPNTSLSAEQVRQLHQELNTFENGYRLLEELRIDSKYPHRVPQAEGERLRILMTQFGSGQIDKNGIHKSEVSVNSSNLEYIDITSKYLNTCERNSKTKYNYYNSRLTTVNIDEATDVVDKVVDDCSKTDLYLEPSFMAKLTADKKFSYMPLGNMVKGMIVPILDADNNIISEDEIVEITHEHYRGKVYDLSLESTRNFIANGIAVHNCIYEWRGSDPSIILTISATFNMPTFVLSTNYRCLNEIVDYAAVGIQYNNSRYNKSMTAFNKGGTVKILPSEKEDLCNLSILALNHIKWWLANGNSANDIAVLSRNNFHLALLSNMLLREGIYCNMTEEMKLTKSYMYNDVKDIIALSEPNWNKELTARILWKLCRFMGIGMARNIANFQDSCALSLDDTLGYLIKHFIDRNISYDKKVNVSVQAEEQMRYYMNRLSSDTRDDLKVVYSALKMHERYESIRTLLYQYLNACSFMYKSEDKNRSIQGLVKYVINLMIKDGVDKMIEFFRVTEQLENGKMVIPGEKVTLTTIHSAKGREWKNVIMFACDNVSQPSFNGIRGMIEDEISIGDIFENLDEERRLFYVGNTRAKENLLVVTYKIPSVFILEALGAFKGKQGSNNASIVEFTQDENWAEHYKSFILDNIMNPSSKYYYNADDYKINE